MLRDGRTQIVLGTLVVAMAAAALLLLALEPSPTRGRVSVRLSAVEPAADAHSALFDTSAEGSSDPAWSAIVIQSSGALRGSLASVSQAHEASGLRGLGYHFVVGNGYGAPDGQIEIGYRWKQQMAGQFVLTPATRTGAQTTIGVCMIGDADEASPSDMQIERLVWLVRQLQRQYGIPREQVYVQTSPDHADEPGDFFPLAAFRSRLVRIELP